MNKDGRPYCLLLFYPYAADFCRRGIHSLPPPLGRAGEMKGLLLGVDSCLQCSGRPEKHGLFYFLRSGELWGIKAVNQSLRKPTESVRGSGFLP